LTQATQVLLIQLWIKQGFTLPKKLGLGGLSRKNNIIETPKILNSMCVVENYNFLNARGSVTIPNDLINFWWNLFWFSKAGKILDNVQPFSHFFYYPLTIFHKPCLNISIECKTCNAFVCLFWSSQEEYRISVLFRGLVSERLQFFEDNVSYVHLYFRLLNGYMLLLKRNYAVFLWE